MFKLEISGFRSKAEVEAFVNWYENQAEQDASIWFGEIQILEKIDRDFTPVDCSATYPIKFEDDKGFMVIK